MYLICTSSRSRAACNISGKTTCISPPCPPLYRRHRSCTRHRTYWRSRGSHPAILSDSSVFPRSHRLRLGGARTRMWRVCNIQLTHPGAPRTPWHLQERRVCSGRWTAKSETWLSSSLERDSPEPCCLPPSHNFHFSLLLSSFDTDPNSDIPSENLADVPTTINNFTQCPPRHRFPPSNSFLLSN
jgi:hypothetical protein